MLSELALFGYLGIKCSVVAYWFVNEGIHKLRQKLVWGWDFQFFLKTNEKIRLNYYDMYLRSTCFLEEFEDTKKTFRN